MLAERVAIGKILAIRSLVDDHDEGSSFRVRWRDEPASDQRHTQRVQIASGDGPIAHHDVIVW